MLNYKKQDFRSDQLLKAEHLNYIEDGVEQIFNSIEEMCPPLNLEDNLISCYPLEEISLNPKTYIEAAQAGEGDPSPDNIREISGWDATTITRCGKNLLNPAEWKTETRNGIKFVNENGRVTLSGTCSLEENTVSDYILLSEVALPKGEYTISGSPVGGDVFTYRLFVYIKKEGATDRYISDFGKGSKITIAEGEIIDRLSIRIGGQLGTVDKLVFEPMLTVGANVTQYEPYIDEIHTAQFPETIYGGELDWNTGILTVDKKAVTYDGSADEKWNTLTGENGNVIFQITTDSNNTQNNTTNIMCNRMPVSANNVWYGRGNGITLALNYIRLCVMEIEQTVDAYREWLNENTVTVVYPIEPYTIQLTPQQILALSGTNNIWSNTGKTKISSFANPAKIIKENEETIENFKARVSALETAIVNNV